MGPQIFDIFGDNNAKNAKIAESIFKIAGKKFPITVTKIANNTMYAIQGFWQDKAKQEAKGWGRRYAGTIQVDPIRRTGGEGRVYANERNPDFMFVLFVENGIKPWNISEALMQSKKVKYSAKTGLPFLRIPFRWRTPTQGTGNVAQAHSSFAGVMPQSVYEKVLAGGKIDKDFAAEAGNANLAGLVRFDKELHAQYHTFRTVTSESNWQHPGTGQRPVYSKVLDMVGKSLAEGLESYVKQFENELQEENE